MLSLDKKRAGSPVGWVNLPCVSFQLFQLFQYFGDTICPLRANWMKNLYLYNINNIYYINIKYYLHVF